MARKPKQAVESLQASEFEQVDVSTHTDTASANEAELGNYAAEYRSRCGGALRIAREKQGLSTQDIASRLRLSNKQIEALEADNFAALPEATIVKGFIRNYAKQLKVDAAPLLDAYSVIVPSAAPQSFTLKPSVNMKVTEYEKPKLKRLIALGLAAVLGFGAWYFYQNYVQKPNPVNPSAELTQPAVTEALPEVALPAAERVAEETVTQLTLPEAATASAGAISKEAASSQTSAQSSPASNTVATTNNSPLAPQPPTVPAAAEQFETSIGMTKLVFNASQETWVSVTDASGKEIYNKTLFAGNRETFEAKSPFNVVVGNAVGATLEVNGKPVALAPHTRTNVAHVKVE